ncbi:MAG: cell division protein ZapA [Hyphomicrobiaceae bacterium]
MGQVSVSLNGRTYRLRCGDGEEKRIAQLAQHLSSKIDTLVGEFGSAGHDRLLVMAALLVTDELFELKDRTKSARDPRRPDPRPGASDGKPPEGA